MENKKNLVNKFKMLLKEERQNTIKKERKNKKGKTTMRVSATMLMRKKLLRLPSICQGKCLEGLTNLMRAQGLPVWQGYQVL